MSHSSESHSTHDLNATMSDPSMTVGLVERLRFRASTAHLAFYTNLADHAALDREAASLLTKQADDIDRLTREVAYQAAVNSTLALENDLNKRMFHEASHAATAAEARIAVLEAALSKIIDMNVQYAIDRYGDAAKAEDMACVSIARNALVTP